MYTFQSNFRQEVAPPPELAIRYNELLRNNSDWVKFIVQNCKGPHLPNLPPNTCNSSIQDKKCRCCINRWSIVIISTFAGDYVPYLIGITDIDPSGGYVSGYIYPELGTIQQIGVAVHIGCI